MKLAKTVFSILTMAAAVTGASPARAALLTVTHTGDSGSGSLRQAILDANADPNTSDTIAFNIPRTDPGFDGRTFTIRVLSELPTIRQMTSIDGSSQTAFTGQTNPLGPEVVLDGSGLGSGSGLVVSGDGNVVRGLVINGFPGTGLVFSRLPFDPTPSNNQALDNYIGTDPTGTTAVPNGFGLSIGGFGSPSVQARNNVVQGNIVSGNGGGISLCDAGDTRIVDNFIGTDRTGTLPLGNGSHGIGLFCAGDPRTLIRGNTIAFNAGDGVHDAPDYRFGVAFTPDGHQGNAVRQNAVFANRGLGINLLPPPFPPTEPPSTVTPNDACDADTGGNLLQNFPVITRATRRGTTTVVDGTLDSASGQVFEIDLFANAAADASGFEGQRFLTSVTVTTDGSCSATFTVTLPFAVARGEFITATATDAGGNTSEFSAAVPVAGNLPFCEIEASQATYADGEIVTLSRLRIANPTAAPVSVELKAWVQAPGSPALALVNTVSTLPAGFDQTFGPFPLATVTPATPRGLYVLGCLLEDPVTGDDLTRQVSRFEVR